MPEAAEVETTRRELAEMEGQKLQRLEVFYPKLQIYGNEKELEGRKLLEVMRQGKLLGLLFEEGKVLAVHLRMTGRWVRGGDEKARATLHFSSGALSFLDSRGFGTMALRDAEDWKDGLGPDLFSLPPGWTPEERWKGSSRATKAILLDQRVSSGIGNYLADEALWNCSVHPALPAKSLPKKKWAPLYESAAHMARATLGEGGVSIRDFLSMDGKEGKGEEFLAVYGRAGEPCLRCGEDLEKTKVAGRGTTFCPSCQRL